MALDPVEAAFRNLPAAQEAAPLPTWTPTGAPDAESVNRFRQAMGDIGEASPAERVWDMVRGWSDSVRADTDRLSAGLRQYPEDLSISRLLGLQIEVHRINMAQNLMAKTGSSVNETVNALLRGQ